MKRVIIATTWSADDIEFIVDVYGFESTSRTQWEAECSQASMLLSLSENGPVLTVTYSDGRTRTIRGTDSILRTLDKLMPDIFASVSIFDKSGREYIQAASGGLRELSSKLVRVKSSNIWSYGIDIQDRKSGVGDVMVQFKGKNGGPTGGLYIYYDVPVKLWRMWLSALSKGHFFWVYIRDNFQYRKLDGDRRTHLKNGLN